VGRTDQAAFNAVTSQALRLLTTQVVRSAPSASKPTLILRKIIESDRSFSSNPDSHFHRKRTPVFMKVDSLEAWRAAHAGVVSGV